MADPLKITAWSYSRWKDYQKCPRLAKYKHVDKLRTPASPAMDRGTAIHKSAEDFVNGTSKKLDPALKFFKKSIQELRAFGAKAEGEMAFTIGWEPTGWFSRDAWCRVKLDVTLIQPDESEFIVIDYKTGKKYDDHADQLKLYGLAGLITAPKIPTCHAQDWYTDLATDNVLEERFTQKDVAPLKKDWAKRTMAMLNDAKFAPLPSRECGWCFFSKAKGGPCEF